MKIDAFATLEAVLRHGTFAAAASEKHLTASAVSIQIKQLESFFGQPLFDRSKAQLRPTPLANQASEVMAEALSKINALREPNHIAVEGVVTLGVLESQLPLLLPPVLQQAQQRFPGLDVRIVSGRSSGLVEAVKAGEIHCALVAQPEDGGSSRLHWAVMERREMVLVHPLASSKLAPLELFQKYQWIRYNRKSTSGQQAYRYVQKQGFATHGKLEFDTAGAILSLVSEGHGVSILEISEPGILQTYPVAVQQLGAHAPSYKLALTMCKANQGKRSIAALEICLKHALDEACQRRKTGRESLGIYHKGLVGSV